MNDLQFIQAIPENARSGMSVIAQNLGVGLFIYVASEGLKRLLKRSFPTIALFAVLGLGLSFFPHALAQVDLGGGKSMMGDLGFLKDIGSTSQDIMFLIAKLLGAGLVLFGIKSIGQRNWEYAIPQLVSGGGLFFVPQIVAAFQKMAGG